MAKREPILRVGLKDCRVDTFRAGGKGGQNQNKTNSGVRVVHEPSGAVGESREHRDQLQNKKAAFNRMANSDRFQNWARLASLRKLGETKNIDQRVEHELAFNTVTEVKDEKGNWVDEKEIYKAE